MLAHASKEERQRVSLVDLEELYKHYHLPYKRERLLAHLQALIEADIVERVWDASQYGASDTTLYRIPVGLIRQWLRKEKPVDMVLRDSLAR
jgi:hypothetical protein